MQKLGRYTVIEEIGQGGFSTVYSGLDPLLDREVALKVMRPELLADPTFSQRFRREARALAALRHPQIIVIYEVAEAEGRLFIVMEKANGPSLAKRIAEAGPLPWSEALAVLKPVCQALEYAHRQNVVHRDLKPSNILLDAERGALLSDFGLARVLVEGAGAGVTTTTTTGSGGILGTPSYIAPELWEFETADPRSDMYSLGCIIFEMLTGKMAFGGQTPMQILRAHDRGPQFPAHWPEGVPAGVGDLLAQALSRDPAARPNSPLALLQALEDLAFETRENEARARQVTAAAEWRAEALAAIQAGEWGAARMLVGRWLAIAPADPEALAARAEIERRQKAEPESAPDVSTTPMQIATVLPAPPVTRPVPETPVSQPAAEIPQDIPPPSAGSLVDQTQAPPVTDSALFQPPIAPVVEQARSPVGEQAVPVTNAAAASSLRERLKFNPRELAIIGLGLVFGFLGVILSIPLFLPLTPLYLIGHVLGGAYKRWVRVILLVGHLILAPFLMFVNIRNGFAYSDFNYALLFTNLMQVPLIWLLLSDRQPGVVAAGPTTERAGSLPVKVRAAAAGDRTAEPPFNLRDIAVAALALIAGIGLVSINADYEWKHFSNWILIAGVAYFLLGPAYFVASRLSSPVRAWARLVFLAFSAAALAAALMMFLVESSEGDYIPRVILFTLLQAGLFGLLLTDHRPGLAARGVPTGADAERPAGLLLRAALGLVGLSAVIGLLLLGFLYHWLDFSILLRLLGFALLALLGVFLLPAARLARFRGRVSSTLLVLCVLALISIPLLFLHQDESTEFWSISLRALAALALFFGLLSVERRAALSALSAQSGQPSAHNDAAPRSLAIWIFTGLLVIAWFGLHKWLWILPTPKIGLLLIVIPLIVAAAAVLNVPTARLFGILYLLANLAGWPLLMYAEGHSDILTDPYLLPFAAGRLAELILIGLLLFWKPHDRKIETAGGVPAPG